jgi:PAS domain S-box-containing protein
MIEDNTIVLCHVYGYVTKEIIENILEQNEYYTEKLKKQNKPTLLLTDLSDVVGVSPEAREAVRAIGSYLVDRSAIYGANAFLTLIAQYVIRRDGVGGNTKIFRTKHQALNYLQNKKDLPHLLIARLIAVLVVLAGLAVVAGWYLGVGSMQSLALLSEPINPVVGINLAIVGFALLLLTTRKTLWKKIAVRSVAGWLVIFGLFVVLRTWFGFANDIDTWPLPAGFVSDVPPCPGAIAVLFMLTGILTGLASYNLAGRVSSMIFRAVMIASILRIFAMLIAFGFDLTEERVVSTLLVLFVVDASLILIAYRASGRFPVARKIMLRYGQGVGIFVAIMVVTLFAWQRSRHVEETSSLDRTADAIIAEIDSNIDVLRGYKAFFRSSNFVGESEFNRYFTESGLNESNPGIASIGFLQQTPERDGSVTYPITYVTPITDEANYGADLSMDSDTLQLLERARDSGDIVSSDDIDNAPLVKNSRRHELLIVTAVYASGTTEPTTVSERRDRLYGFVVAEFDYDAFFSNFFESFTTDKNSKLTIADLHDGDVLYKSPAAQDDPVESSRVITVANHSWAINILKNNFGAGGLSYGPNVVLLAGTLLGLLTALLVVSLVRRRHEALKLAEAITDDLEVERNRAIRIAQKDEAIIASIGDGLVVVDASGRIVLTNQRFSELFGWELHEVKDKKLEDVLIVIDNQGKKIAQKQRPITRALHTNSKVEVSLKDGLKYKRKDGSLFPAACTVTPIQATGMTAGAIEIIRDITIEAEIDRVKMEFVSLASHQLRTPLTAAKWYAELLIEGEAGTLKPAQEKYVQEVHGATLRAIKLVSSLLNLSRIEMGNIVVDPEPTDIIALTKSVVHDLAEQIADRKIVMHEEYPGSSLVLQIDPRLTRIMIENLLTNAIKYTPAKAPVTLNISKDKSGVLINVRDAGYGIPIRQQDKIFTKLFRADNIKVKNTEGTGLGLYLVRSIVDYTGSKIWFESVENKGSSFYIHIPSSGMKKRSGSSQVIL